jgi:glutaminase
MSVMAATLANGGLNPITGKRVFNPEHIRNVLPLILTSGMYDYSGQWAFDIGVPAKSGVGGSVFIVIPNIAGITVWSPRLDQVGNSVRGVHVAKELLKRISFHSFEVFSGHFQSKMDPTMRKNDAEE